MASNIIENWIPDLTAALAKLDAQAHISTQDFTDAVEKILPVFEHMGPFFSIARNEMHGKNVSLQKAAVEHTTLDQVVQHDIKAKTVQVKGSCARNLHRILTSISFISEILKNLAGDATMTLHTAAADAYDKTLSPVHSWVVRMAVKTGMYTLPTREHFLRAIGEKEYATAKAHAAEFCKVSDVLIAEVEKLYGDVKIPRSDTAWGG